MTPPEFVAEMKRIARSVSASTRDYLGYPPVADPPGHLGEFSRWYRGLADDQRETAGLLMDYVAEGSLFALLSTLDHGTPESRLELFAADGEARTRLNDPEGDLLCELFNRVP
ncbi:hypothetical protein TA3x_000073 [Tundrisphaera sp. TA3]|uniref:hypothetical protein n=1 Tax=Tundrisphaera sp. TA3 TaxID=3435775 RepID=UPI003EBBFDA4